MAEEKKAKKPGEKKLKTASNRQAKKFANDPMGQAAYNAFGQDYDLFRGAAGGYNLSNNMFGDAFGRLDPNDQNAMVDRFRSGYDSFAQRDPVVDAAYNQVLQDAQGMRSQIPAVDQDIARTTQALGGFQGDVDMARQLIDRAWNQRDPQAAQALQMMMDRSQGFSPEERALMMDNQRSELLRNQQAQLAQAQGQMGARGLRGGIASAFQANQGAALDGQMRQAGRDTTLASINRGDQMLGGAGNLISQILQTEASNRNAATGAYQGASGAYAQTNATLGDQRKLRQNILQQAAESTNQAGANRTQADNVRVAGMSNMGQLYNSAQQDRNTMEQFNIGQGLNKQLALYQGLLQGAASTVQNREANRAYQLGQDWISATRDGYRAQVEAAAAGRPVTQMITAGYNANPEVGVK